MQIGMIGLGRMGGNIVRRLMQHGHEAVVYDRDAKAVAALSQRGRERRRRPRQAGAASCDRRARSGSCCRPARSPKTRSASSAELLEAGDIVIDGGNTFWKDDIRRAKMLQGARHPLRRCRHQRRRVGARARLLHDDRRREGRSSIASIRSSRRWRPGSATCRARPAATAATRAPSRATSMPGRTAPGISSRWSTTASNTA